MYFFCSHFRDADGESVRSTSSKDISLHGVFYEVTHDSASHSYSDYCFFLLPELAYLFLQGNSTYCILGQFLATRPVYSLTVSAY